MIIFPTSNKEEIKALMKEYGHRKLTDEKFVELFNHATKEPYSFLHINLQSKNPDEIYRRKFSTVLVFVQ